MSGTASPPGVDVPRLEAFLHDTVPGLLSGPLAVTLLAGGRSNLTYLLADGRDRWVLRRPLLGHVRRPRRTWAASTGCSVRYTPPTCGSRGRW